MDRNTSAVLFFVFCLSFLACSASDNIGQSVEAVIQPYLAKNVRLSIKIIDCRTGATVYSYQPDQPLIPASNMKIISSAAALKYLGPDYEFKTSVALLGKSLVVVGGADPLLGDEKTDIDAGRTQGWLFDRIIKALRERHITEIQDIIIDAAILDDQRVHPNWPKDQLNRPYACEISGLNYNGNCINITAQKTPRKVNLTITPSAGYVTLINKVVAVSGGQTQIGAYRNSKPNHITIKGRCNQAASFDVAIERPAAFFGFLLAEKLRSEGFILRGKLTGRKVNQPADLDILVEHKTPIALVLERCNKDSFGLAAECLVKIIAAKEDVDHGEGSWTLGTSLLADYLKNLGIDPAQFNIDDGSGLSRTNCLSANTITTVLYHLYKSPDWPIYNRSLAVGGLDGTIRRYFTEIQFKGNIRGKTGYIDAVRSFSGICDTPNGQYIFSIIANNANHMPRTAINAVVQSLFMQNKD
ncbi:MAG: D-alanyl-D-alanine carboxypeptidase/D-alanyl-D-alanine-endopeptidase [Planctomycetota bacterium]